jgi:hypothetical protein
MIQEMFRMRTKLIGFSWCVLCVYALLLTACSQSETASKNTTSSSTTATTATAATKSKPTGPVKVDQSLCDRILTKTEVGQTTSTTVNNIRVISTDEGGSCNYETAPAKASLVVTFYSLQGVDALDMVVAQLKNNPDFMGTITPVSDLGDKAIFIVNPITPKLIQYRLMVAYGTLWLDFILPNSSAGDAAASNQVQQLAKLALGRI